MTNLEIIKEKLYLGYDRIIIPKTMLDTPLMMADWQKQDEEGNLLDGFYTVNELSQIFGKRLVPTPIIDDRFVFVHYSLNRNLQDKLFVGYLKQIGMVNMRDSNEDSITDLDVEEIDFANLPDNAIGVFGTQEFQSVPKYTPETL